MIPKTLIETSSQGPALFRSRSHRLGFLLAALVLGVIAFTTLSMRHDSFEAIMLRDGPKGLPIPFLQSKNAGLSASLQQIGQTGSGGSIPVYVLDLSTPTPQEDRQLQDDAIYLVRTPAQVETMPFDIAFQYVAGHVPDYFLYKYSDADASAEIANQNAGTFSQRFPGLFGASAQAWANESAHGNALSAFEQAHNISFVETNASQNGLRFEPNALYAVVINEPGGAVVELQPVAVCGDNWKLASEQCDDGNTTAGDGCSTSCTVESGYVCTFNNPSICEPIMTSSSSSSSSTESSASSESSYSSSSESSSSSSEQSSSSSSSSSSSEESSSSISSSSSSVSSVTIDMNEAASFVMHADTIPNFTQNPTVVAVRDGQWSDPLIWNTGNVPVAGDIVRVESGVTVGYDVVSDASLKALGVKGSLLFPSDQNTRLKVGTIQVYPQGYLEVGTEQNPIDASVTAEIVIADQPLDTGVVGNPGTDPVQWGVGLLSYGKVRMHGAEKARTWIGLAQPARSGSLTVQTTEAMTNWQPGETVVFPDTRQPTTSADGSKPSTKFGAMGANPQWEEHIIDSVNGTTITFTEPLKFSHSGAVNMDGVLEFLPHIGVLDRNVIVRSENPNGTRGHVAFIHRADVDVRYSRFVDLGRSDAFFAADNTALSNGVPTHIGTNQIGRYAMHFHHLYGPVNPTNTGYQYRFIGNTVDRSLKWNVAVHGTSYGLLMDNVVYDGQGGGFVTEDAAEIGNEFIRNYVVRMIGTFIDGKEGTDVNDLSRGGNGFWFRRSGNIVRDNVVANAAYSAYYYSSYFLTNAVKLPNFRGADPSVDFTLTAHNPFGEFDNNEGYGMTTTAMWLAYTTGNDDEGATPSLFKNSRFWHIGHTGVSGYHTANSTFDNVTMIFDPKANTRNDTGPRGYAFTKYKNTNVVIENSRIEGAYWGIIGPNMDASDFYADRPSIVRNSVLRNHVNMYYLPPNEHDHSVAGSMLVENVRFTGRIGPNFQLPAGGTPLQRQERNIVMNTGENMTRIFARSTFVVRDYNQVPGDDFQVFFKEQSGSALMPQTSQEFFVNGDTESARWLGSPEANRSNTFNWNRYRLVTGGRFTPCLDDVTHPEILGYTCPVLAEPSPSVIPYVALALPFEGQQVTVDNPVPMYYTINDNYIPAGYDVFFSIDSQTPFRIVINNDLLYRYKFPDANAEGAHTLRAYIGNIATGQPLAGTLIECVAFGVSTAVPPVTYPTNGLCPTQYSVAP